MAAAEPTGLTFVDEDDLPVAFLRIAHVDSDNEAPSDVDSSKEGEPADESGEESNECEDTEECDYSNLMWSSVIRPPQDRNFNEEVGMRVEMECGWNPLPHAVRHWCWELLRICCLARLHGETASSKRVQTH